MNCYCNVPIPGLGHSKAGLHPVWRHEVHMEAQYRKVHDFQGGCLVVHHIFGLFDLQLLAHGHVLFPF